MYARLYAKRTSILNSTLKSFISTCLFTKKSHLSPTRVEINLIQQSLSFRGETPNWDWSQRTGLSLYILSRPQYLSGFNLTTQIPFDALSHHWMLESEILVSQSKSTLAHTMTTLLHVSVLTLNLTTRTSPESSYYCHSDVWSLGRYFEFIFYI